MKKRKIKESLEQFDAGSATPEQEEAARLWLFQLNQNKDLKLTGERLDEVSDQMWAAIAARQKSTKRKPVRLWRRIAIASAAATVIFGAVLLYYHQSGRKEQPVYANDVAPGIQGATLTLANGKKIRLSDAADGELAEEAGVLITKSGSGQLLYEIKGSSEGGSQVNTLSTANGETYQVRLPDGSLVWLNSSSSLVYPANLMEGGKRRVKLNGEAYFDVAKDTAHPFVVQTADQYVEVLGTEFNINSYADEPAVTTTLVEGSVKVSAAGLQKVIRPGEQAIHSGGRIQVARANIENITDWKGGDFYLNRVDFRTAMRKIARWYDVEVVYDSSVPDNIKSGGWISRSNKLSSVLRSIEISGLAHFRIEGRKIYVTR